MNAQEILTAAYLSLKPFDDRGRLVNAQDAYASKVLASASSRLKQSGFSNYAGSVDRLFAHLDAA